MVLGKQCPACNQTFATFLNKGLKQSLIQLQVYCTHHSGGCKWKGELGQLDQHLNENPKPGMEDEGCQFVEIKCVHCNEQVRRRHIVLCCPKQPVRCHYSDKGCQWEGVYGELERHLNVITSPENRHLGCKFVELACTYQCGELLQRYVIIKHETNHCRQRPSSCDYCKEYKSTFEDVTDNHLQVCKYYPVPCPNNCAPIMMERQILEHHLSKECPLAMVECSFSYAGCEVKLPRKELSAHIEENPRSHVSLLATYSQKLGAENLEKEKHISLQKHLHQQQSAELKELRAHHAHSNAKWWLLGAVVLFLLTTLIAKLQKLQQLSKCEEFQQSMQDFVAGEGQACQAAFLVWVKETERIIGGLNEVRWSFTVFRILLTLFVVSVIVAAVAILLHPVPRKIRPTWYSPPFYFEKHRQSHTVWYSPPFYTHPRGYKMRLRVDANGNGDAKGTHVSVFVCLMRGEYDDHLKWPFNRDITIQLLDQEGREEHHTVVIRYTDGTTNRVTVGKRSCEWGATMFIPHNKLSPKFLKNNCLLFRVLKVEHKD